MNKTSITKLYVQVRENCPDLSGNIRSLRETCFFSLFPNKRLLFQKCLGQEDSTICILKYGYKDLQRKKVHAV